MEIRFHIYICEDGGYGVEIIPINGPLPKFTIVCLENQKKDGDFFIRKFHKETGKATGDVKKIKKLIKDFIINARFVTFDIKRGFPLDQVDESTEFINGTLDSYNK